MTETLKIANDYGNVVVAEMPPGYVHVPGKRLQPLCRRLGIRFAPAVVDWTGSGRHCKPVLDGVVVSRRSADRLRAAVAERTQRNPPKPVQEICVLAALWVINRRAKRCRDMAQSYYQAGLYSLATTARNEKVWLYRQKGQVLAHLLAEGRLVVDGYHRFPGGNWAEVLRGGGLHVPPPL